MSNTKNYMLRITPGAAPVIIEGISATDAVSNYFSDDVAMYVRGSIERGSFTHVVRQVILRDGTGCVVGPRIAVKRLTPRIEKIEVAA